METEVCHVEVMEMWKKGGGQWSTVETMAEGRK